MTLKKVKYFKVNDRYLIITFKKTLWTKRFLYILEQEYKNNDGYLGTRINANNEIEIIFLLRNKKDIEPYLKWS